MLPLAYPLAYPALPPLCSYPGSPDDDEEIENPHIEFDREHGGLDDALQSGVLPARFFGREKKGVKRASSRSRGRPSRRE